jgi:hypothetical protein
MVIMRESRSGAAADGAQSGSVDDAIRLQDRDGNTSEKTRDGWLSKRDAGTEGGLSNREIVTSSAILTTNHG